SRVARDMTAARPATDMRAAVLSRLDERPRRGVGLFGRWMPLLTLAASVVIAVGTSALWPHAARSVTPNIATIASAPPAAVTAATPTRTAETPDVRVTRVQGAEPSPEAVMTEAEVAWRERALPALSGPSAIAIASLDSDRAGGSIAPIDIQPLVT